MPFLVSDLSAVVREADPDKLFEVRGRGGNLLYEATRHEADILATHGCVEGVANRKGFRYLRLKVAPQTAFSTLRRMLCASARTVCEASQLTIKFAVPGGGVVYSHFMRRIQAYSPGNRSDIH